jgi:hypothetical protein
MKAKVTILLSGLMFLSIFAFTQTTYLTYTFVESGARNSSEYSSASIDMVTLESDFREVDILKLTDDNSDLNFRVIQTGKSGVFKAISNFQIFDSVEFSIFNNKGVEINRGTLSEIETEINLSAMPSGNYIFHIYLNKDDFQVFRINLK